MRQFFSAVRFSLNHALDKNITQVASSLTFTSVLGIVPLLAVVLALFTAFPLFAEFQEALEGFLTDNLMPPAVSSTVMGYLNLFATKASGLTTIGSVALMVTSILLFRTIDDAFNTIWQVRQQRPIRQRILVYWAVLTLGPILTGASLWATSVMASYSAGYIEQLPLGLSFILTLAPLLASILGFAALFFFVPNCHVRARDALLGGLLTALALAGMRAGFAFYLSQFPSYTIIYGAFATIPIFLLWIYLSWIAVLSGATLAAVLPAIRHRDWQITAYAGNEFADTIRVLSVLWHKPDNIPPGCTQETLRLETGLRQRALTDALYELHTLGYVVTTDTDKNERWVFAADRRQAQLRPLVEHLLLHPQQSVRSGQRALAHAVSLVLAGESTTLQELFESPDALSQISHIRQNEPSSTKTTATTEVHHVES